MTRRPLLAAALGSTLALGLVAPVLAHAELVSSDPADKAVLAAPLTAVSLIFSDALDASRSSFILSGPGGAIGTGRVGDMPDGMTLGGLSLEPGAYEVRWTSVAKDGDVLRGTLTFTVAAATPTPATATKAPGAAEPSPRGAADPGAAASPVPSSTPTEPAASSTPEVLLPIAVALVLVAGIGALVLRRSRQA